MVAVIAATLVGTTANAECGNGELPLNIGCQNIDSQVQGDENVVALGAAQVFPEIHHEEPEPPKPPE